MKESFSRRTFLRGAGVALALPSMESLAPRDVQAAGGAVPIRYMAVFLPHGAPDFWVPNGTLNNWKLGSILSPLADVKSKVTILNGLETGSAYFSDGTSGVEPSHGRLPAAWLTCVDAEVVKRSLGTELEANGVSVDQVMAVHPAFAGKTPIPSLQVGLSTVHSFCDDRQCSNSRSVSWHTETQPMYKKVDPLTVFDMLTASVTQGVDPAAAAKRVALKKSVLDGVLESATATRARLSSADRARMDEFLESVRHVEVKATQVSQGMGGLGCVAAPKPTMATVTEDGIRQTTAEYNKGAHADAMNALLVMAWQCDLTRIVTYMLEDERSEFVYDHVPRREFTADTSTVTSGTCPEYHSGGQHGDTNDFAAITHWNVGRVADLAQRLDAVKEANGLSLLDNSVIFFGACMHGGNHDPYRLPSLLIGSAGGKLKTNQYVSFETRPMRDLHLTMMNSVFGMNQKDFGVNLTGVPISVIDEIVAS